MRRNINSRTVLVLAAGFLFLKVSQCFSLDISLIVENKFDRALENELVIVSLDELKISPEQMKGFEDVGVYHGEAKLVGQIDDLLDDGWDGKDEISFFIDFGALERKTLAVRFLKAKRETTETTATVTTTADGVKVKNKFLSFNLNNKGAINDIKLEGQTAAMGSISMGRTGEQHEIHSHTGPVRTVLSFKGKIWLYYDDRGWQPSAYEIMPIISLSEARPEIISFSYIKAVSQPKSFNLLDLAQLHPNTEDFTWHVTSPLRSDPDKHYKTTWPAIKGSSTKCRGWAWAENDKKAAMAMAVSISSNLSVRHETKSQGFIHIIDIFASASRNYLRMRPFKYVFHEEREIEGKELVGTDKFLEVHYFFYPQAPDEKEIEKEFSRISTPFVLLPKVRSSAMKDSFSIENMMNILDEYDPLILCSAPVEKNFKGDITKLAERLNTVFFEEKDSSSFFEGYYLKWPKKKIFLVIIAEPGSKLIDKFAAEYGIADAYLPGPGKERLVLVDDLFGRGRKALFVSGSGLPEVKKSLEKLLAGVEENTVGSICGFVDIYRRIAPWTNHLDTENKILHTWRNAWSELQVLLKPDHDISELTVDVDLPIDARAEVTHILWEYLDREGRKLTGYFPANDVLRPSVPQKIAKDQPVSIWISLYVPETVRPGNYKGTITIGTDTFRKALPIEVKVGSLTLPVKPPISFWPMYSALNSSPNHSNLELCLDVERYTDSYYKTLTNISRVLGLYGADVASLSYANISGIIEGEKVILDTTKLEREVAAYRKGNPNLHHFIYIYQQVHWQRIVNTISLATGWDEKRACEAFGKELREAFRKLGIAESVYAYIEDEPRDYVQWVKQAQVAKWMGMKCTVAINHCAPQQMETAVGVMDLWIPLWQRFLRPNFFSREFYDERKKDGNPIWLYTCAGANPRANFGLSNTQVPYLILDSWSKGAEGVLYYGGLFWSHALDRGKGMPYEDLWRANKSNNPSGSSTFYPDKENKTIVPSQRAQIFRESFQIVKAVDLLKQRKGKQAIASLLTECLTEFDADPDNYYLLKKKLFEMAE